MLAGGLRRVAGKIKLVHGGFIALTAASHNLLVHFLNSFVVREADKQTVKLGYIDIHCVQVTKYRYRRLCQCSGFFSSCSFIVFEVL